MTRNWTKGPAGTLVLEGVQVGEGGQAVAVHAIRAGTVTIDPGSIATVTRGAATATLAGAAAGDVIVLVPPASLNDDLIFCGAAVTGTDQITAYLYNPTGGAIDDTARVWSYLLFDLTE
jgi:hypothetical protein